MGNVTSWEPTMFWTLNSVNRTGNPRLLMILAYFLHAVFESSSDLAPVQTIFPELNTRAVVLGFQIFMMAAANHLGLYSVFLARKAISLRSSLHCRFTVETMFWRVGVPGGSVGISYSSLRAVAAGLVMSCNFSLEIELNIDMSWFLMPLILIFIRPNCSKVFDDIVPSPMMLWDWANSASELILVRWDWDYMGALIICWTGV